MTEQLITMSQPINIQSSPLAMYHTIRIDDVLADMQDWIPALQVIEGAQAGDTLHFKYNCQGGRVDIMNAFLSAMEQTEATIVSEIVGHAMSAASIMFLRGGSFIVNRYAEFMAHCTQSGSAYSSIHNIKQRVDFSREQDNKATRDEYKHFLTPDEIEEVVNGQEIYLNADDIIERLATRQQLFEQESEEFIPDPEVMKEWSKERLLSFMFDEEYDNDYWESVEEVLGESLSEESETTPDSKDVYGRVALLTSECEGGDLGAETSYVEFNGGLSITDEGWLLDDLDEYLLHMNAHCSQEGLSTKEIKQIADNLGVPYKNNATKKVVAKLVLDFIKKVVDILNS